MDLRRRTAERMLQNIDKQLQALATRQQSMNNNVGGKMRKGGRVKMTKGGIPAYLDPNTRSYTGIKRPGLSPMDGQDNWWNRLNDKQFPFALGNVGVSGQAPIAITDQNLATVNAATSSLSPQPNYGPGGNHGGMNQQLQGLMPNFNQVQPNSLIGTNNPAAQPGWTPPKGGMDFNNLMGIAPSIFNGIAGLMSGRADKINPNKYQNPYESQAFGMMPDQYRVDDQLNDVRNQYANYMRNVRQVGNSRGEIMANAGAGMNRANEANTRIWAQKNNQENQMRTNKAGMRNDQGIRRAGINLQVKDMNDANQSASRNRRMSYFGAAASGAQKYGLTQQQMANQSESQNAYIDALKNTTPWMTEWLKLQNYGSKKA